MEVGLLRTNKKVFILGAGPAGISLSYYLSKLGIKNIVFEARNIVGGMARSWHWNDFIVDTGPHILHTDDKEIWDLWGSFLGENLIEGNFYSGNSKTIKNKNFLFDYPLNINQIKNIEAWTNDELKEITNELNSSKSEDSLGNASSFREYIQHLVGNKLEKTFFRYYPQKVWGIPTNEMLPDWAPKRIRICKSRETFYRGEYCGISSKGTGYLMNRIKDESSRLHSEFHLSRKVIGLSQDNNLITGIKTLDKNTKSEFFPLEENDLVINTLPITTVSNMLGNNINITFRGIASLYVEFTNSKNTKILPEDFNWLYFGDQKNNFNRITEPTSMAKDLDTLNQGRNYLIIESCHDHTLDLNELKACQDKSLDDLINLPFIDGEKSQLKTSINWEPYVYPIQSLINRKKLKEAQNWIANKARNIESLGTSADFAYNDIQVIFKKAKELADDINEDAYIDLSRSKFNKIIEQNKKNNLIKAKKNKNSDPDNLSITDIYKEVKEVKLIAELGINHNGSKEQLLKLCELACDSGADIVKFQYFDSKKRIGSKVRELEHIEKAQEMEENILQLLNRCELNLETIIEAKKYVESKGLIAMCTPFGIQSLRDLINSGFIYIKVSSMDLNNFHLHKEICNTPKSLSLFLSTGMSSLEELNGIYDIYKDSHHNVCILLCTSSYPAPNSDISLSNLLFYKNLFPKFKIGYSDHTTENIAALCSAALGAEFIELHFSDNVRKSGPDQILSKTPNDFIELRKSLDSLQELIKFKPKSLRTSEYSTWRVQKKGLYSSKRIKAGEAIHLNNTKCESPPTDISPFILHHSKLIAKKDILENVPISKEDIIYQKD